MHGTDAYFTKRGAGNTDSLTTEELAISDARRANRTRRRIRNFVIVIVILIMITVVARAINVSKGTPPGASSISLTKLPFGKLNENPKIYAGTIGNYLAFRRAMPGSGVRTRVLLTRSPLPLARPLDLHALSTPPAFILDQDQIL